MIYIIILNEEQCMQLSLSDIHRDFNVCSVRGKRCKIPLSRKAKSKLPPFYLHNYHQKPT